MPFYLLAYRLLRALDLAAISTTTNRAQAE